MQSRHRRSACLAGSSRPTAWLYSTSAATGDPCPGPLAFPHGARQPESCAAEARTPIPRGAPPMPAARSATKTKGERGRRGEAGGRGGPPSCPGGPLPPARPQAGLPPPIVPDVTLSPRQNADDRGGAASDTRLREPRTCTEGTRPGHGRGAAGGRGWEAGGERRWLGGRAALKGPATPHARRRRPLPARARHAPAGLTGEGGAESGRPGTAPTRPSS